MGGTGWESGEQPSNGGTGLIAACVALSVIQIIFVAAKFYTRSMQNTRYGADEWVMLVALIGSLAKAILYIVLVVKAGLGYHIDDLAYPHQDISLIKKGFIALEIFDFPLTITPAKISLLLFYVQIFYTRKFQVAAYFVGAIVLGLGISVFFQTIFQCSPIAYGWDPKIADGSCINQTIVYRAVSPINVATGVMIVALPIPLIWRLHTRTSQKLALTGVFLLSGLGIIVSVFRMLIYYTSSSADLSDVTWLSVRLGILTVVESAIIIIATCLVGIWPLITRIMPRTWLSKISCCQRHRATSNQNHHQQWYMQNIREQAKTRSDEQLAPHAASLFRREETWSSRPSSLSELEDQRSCTLDDDTSIQHPTWVSYEVHITGGDQKINR
ncbi:hypothetical protein N7488_010411 [Penicillium malachiteum]|nr:hypothetical protein N7488_010411 [Penicillium malachiteum]